MVGCWVEGKQLETSFSVARLKNRNPWSSVSSESGREFLRLVS